MYSSPKYFPEKERKRDLEKITSQITTGEYDPLPRIFRGVKHRELNRRRTSISRGLIAGGLSMVVFGTTLSLTPGLTGLLGGGIFSLIAIPSFGRYSKVKKAYCTNSLEDLVDYLTDEELYQLNDFRQSFKPATKSAKASFSKIKKVCEQAFIEEPEDDENSEIIDVKATKNDSVSSDSSKPSEDSKIDRFPAMQLTLPGIEKENVKKLEPGITEPSPWADAKITTNPNSGLSKVTLSQDRFLDKIDSAIQQSAQEIAPELNNKLDKLRHDTEITEAVLDSRLTDLEDALKQALEISEKSASGQESGQTLKTLDVQGLQPSTPTCPLDENAPVHTPVHVDGPRVAFDVFDPLQPEKENEFEIFETLMKIEKLSPHGMPIMTRMWGVSSGGSKKTMAARNRRDEFATRVELVRKLSSK